MANTTELRQVEPTVWKACAGTSVQIPTVDSRVYYFPQGHAEQASSPPFLSPLVSSQPLILCRVAAVLFLANSDTDEVFAKIRLLPLLRSPNPDFSSRGGDVDVDEEAVVSFAKILTPSDANNGGGFSVPRFCADSIFPPLNFAADPPVQTLSITDVHGVVWEFRHIYRGTPRRHLLTTGWSKFVNHKKLIAGDSVVFMRNQRSGEFFIGVRRAVRSNADFGGRWNSPVGSVRVKTEEDGNRGKEGFSRNGKGRVSAESVAEAAELAAQGMGFDVVYYPRVGWADFVVKAETVEESLSVFWTAGVRVKMGMETEDSSRRTWFQGTVSSATVPDNGPWRRSPWRMLQGARQDPFCVSSLSNFTSENNHHMCSDKLVGNNMTPKLKTVSTELNIGSSQTDNLSPDSQSSVHFFGNDLVRKQGCNSSTKVSLGSFQLFGKIIHTKDPVENGFDDAGCKEDNGCKMFKEADGMKNSLDLSLTCPYTNLLDGLDVQCQRASAVEACSL
ncbi:hypothetical protein ACSBR1_001503 [Camellia fascicularis]